MIGSIFSNQTLAILRGNPRAMRMRWRLPVWTDAMPPLYGLAEPIDLTFPAGHLPQRSPSYNLIITLTKEAA